MGLFHLARPALHCTGRSLVSINTEPTGVIIVIIIIHNMALWCVCVFAAFIRKWHSSRTTIHWIRKPDKWFSILNCLMDKFGFVLLLFIADMLIIILLTFFWSFWMNAFSFVVGMAWHVRFGSKKNVCYFCRCYIEVFHSEHVVCTIKWMKTKSWGHWATDQYKFDNNENITDWMTIIILL